MKASDFEIDWNTGIFNCCHEDIQNRTEDVKAGDVIECEECGIEMILQKHPETNVLMWRRKGGYLK